MGYNKVLQNYYTEKGKKIHGVEPARACSKKMKFKF